MPRVRSLPLPPTLLALGLAACSGGKGGGFTVYNTPPSVAIREPANGAEFTEGEAIQFTAEVNDAQDDPRDLTLSWTSDIDGLLSDEGAADSDGIVTFTTASLSAGNHVITLQVLDTESESEEDWIELSLLDLPEAPEITIVHPIPGEHGTEGEEFGFVAIVEDAQDAPEDLLIAFSSDLDGVFCEPVADAVGKASCDAALNPGEHILSFSVTDSDGLVDEALVFYEVTALGDVDNDKDGWTPDEGDCDDTDGDIHPGASEEPNEEDDDCDGTVDESTVLYDDDGDGTSEVEGDCDDSDDDVYEGATEVCDGIDNDCDGEVDEGTNCVDDDEDGYTEIAGDCDDSSSATYPGASEIPDGKDNDCDGVKDEGTVLYDDDGDCFCESGSCTASASSACTSLSNGDCDDGDDEINPDADEECDGDDNDCDGTTDEDDAIDASTWYVDADTDGYGSSSTTKLACSAPTGYVATGSDCDDSAISVHPGATETCNSTDDDCDGATDEGVTTTYYKDADGDGYGLSTSTAESCSTPSGYASVSGDCDDTNGAVSPAATERCNTLDDDCDGTTDEASAVDAATWYRDADSDGFGTSTTTTVSCSAPSGYVSNATDCDDSSASVSPTATEYCNSKDDDCDGTTDEASAADASTWYRDADGDGYGVSTTSTKGCTAPTGYVATSTDCNDGASTISPAATESCNSIDDDCDGSTDEGVTTTYYRDADGDGYGTSTSSTAACSAPTGYVATSGDCDDTDSSLNPATVWYLDADGDGYGTSSYTVTQCAKPTGYVSNKTDCNDLSASASPAGTEACDGIDNDCDSSTDEENASGCSSYYYDYDGDHYGSKTVSAKCLCSSSGYYTATVNTDCYDSNANANPAATTYYSSNRGDGSYDYNCDSTQSKYYTATYNCNYDWTGFACDGYTNGFSSTAPSCGSSGTWRSGCTASWWSCSYTSSSTVTQTCR